MKQTAFLSEPAWSKNLISLIILLSLVLTLTACRKFSDTKKLSFSGLILDDITGTGIAGGGVVKVDGYNANATGYLDNPWRQNIGNGKINPDGTFHVNFNEWANATSYLMNFLHDNNGYINTGTTYLNTLSLDESLFNNGSYNININAARITGLQISFQNIHAANANDELKIIFPLPTDNILFGYLMQEWVNLQNCTVNQMDPIVRGGTGASGILKCNVPADRKFALKWQTKKNGIIQLFMDSLQCLRNTTTLYTLNY